MEAEEKLDLIVKLLEELEQEFDTKAEQVKPFDLPLSRSMTETCSYYFKNLRTGLFSSNKFFILKQD